MLIFPCMCIGENLVSKSPRQVEATAGGGTGEDKDGRSRTADRVSPRHAVLPVRTTWIPSVAGGVRACHGGSPFQPTGGCDGFSGLLTELRRLNFRRQRRRSRLPPLASHQLESVIRLRKQLVGMVNVSGVSGTPLLPLVWATLPGIWAYPAQSWVCFVLVKIVDVINVFYVF